MEPLTTRIETRAMNPQTLKSNPWARRAAWTVGVVLALWALAWLAVPPLLKHQVQKVASEKLGRTVTVGAVDFKPWSMELTVSDLAIATADGKADQVRIAKLEGVLRLAIPVLRAGDDAERADVAASLEQVLGETA